jgi:chorismate mutase/prephenate dehydratase
MTTTPSLNDLRDHIDRIDIALLDLLRQRAEVIEVVRKVKGKLPIYIRPGREAQMLRALLKKPQGRIPQGLVIRLWREMISAFTLQEGALKVAVYAPDEKKGLWDMARDHFGAFTPMDTVPTAEAAVKALIDGKVSVAVVPHIAAGEKNPWWPLLATEKRATNMMFAAGPFEVLPKGRSNARGDANGGVMLAKLYPEPTGDDRGYVVFACQFVPEAEIRRLLSKVGYKIRSLIPSKQGRGKAAEDLYLVEVEGYVPQNDTRFQRLHAFLGKRLTRCVALGGYALPVKAPAAKAAKAA